MLKFNIVLDCYIYKQEIFIILQIYYLIIINNKLADNEVFE